MKRFYPQIRNSFACVVVLLFSAMFWTETASAQIDAPDLPNQNWVSVNEAIATLNQEIGVMDAQLLSSYNEPLDYKRKFYNGMVISLEQGQPVHVALTENYFKFVPGLTDNSYVEIPNPLPLSVWQGYYDEVIQLLQN